MSGRHPSTLTLHQLRYGELPDDVAAEVRAHVHACEVCAPRLRAQENHRAAFELEPVPQAIRTAPRPRPAWSWPRLVLGGLVFAAALLFAAQLMIPTPYDEVRTKGHSATVEIWLQDHGEARPLPADAKVHEGDRIQLRFRRPTHPWVSLVGVDARGTVEIYGTWRADMDTADWQVAPFALELDATPGDQELHTVFSPRRPSEAAIEKAVGDGPPAGWEIRSLTLEKDG